ncbi:MAG: hypothetical protein K8F57_04020, partial [Alphaproteobacteria bacterium]|nr:hypothetical protein [Alphaproteobacteria bacterium]
MKAAINQVAFVSGELDPELAGRTDLQRRYYAAKRLENGIVTPKGSYRKRTGAGLIRSSKDPTKLARSIPFVFSVEQAYMIELGAGYARFYMNGGIIDNPPGTPVEVAMPYSEGELAEVWFFQSFDIIYFLHPKYAPRTLTRSSHTAWTLALFPFWDGPYLGDNTTATTITPAASSGNGVIVTASANIFAATDVGRHLRWSEGKGSGDTAAAIPWGVIVQFDAANQVRIDYKRQATGVNGTKYWRLGRFSDTTGWPSTGSFHGARLFLAGGQEKQTPVASRINDFTAFSPSSPSSGASVRDIAPSSLTVKDDDAVTLALDTNSAHNILWFASAGLLFAGTPGGVFK